MINFQVHSKLRSVKRKKTVNTELDIMVHFYVCIQSDKFEEK